jgi:hypothetical protein
MLLRLSQTHVADVSFAHAILSFVLSLRMVFDKTLEADKVFGNTYYSGVVASITTGYFLWDAGICLYFMHLHGPGFAFHAIACTIIFILSYVRS